MESSEHPKHPLDPLLLNMDAADNPESLVFKKLLLDKNQQTTKQTVQNCPACKEIMPFIFHSLMTILILCLLHQYSNQSSY